MKVAIVFVGATPKQNEFFWPSWKRTSPGHSYDFILVHRDKIGVPKNYQNNLTEASNILEINKVLQQGEIPHKAFGAYRYAFQQLRSKYDVFVFISDDVEFKSDDWLSTVVSRFEKYPKLGFQSPLLSNNPPHIRAPVWMATTNCLSAIEWYFNSDHEGEMSIADNCVKAGFWGTQIGHKIDIAYDPQLDMAVLKKLCGTPMPLRQMEIDVLNGPVEKILPIHTKILQNFWKEFSSNYLKDIVYAKSIINPNIEIGFNIHLEIQPYDGLIYNKSLLIAEKEVHIQYAKDINGNQLEIPGNNHSVFGINNSIYLCKGITKDNPIAVAEIQ